MTVYGRSHTHTHTYTQRTHSCLNSRPVWRHQSSESSQSPDITRSSPGNASLCPRRDRERCKSQIRPRQATFARLAAVKCDTRRHTLFACLKKQFGSRAAKNSSLVPRRFVVRRYSSRPRRGFVVIRRCALCITSISFSATFAADLIYVLSKCCVDHFSLQTNR